MDNARQKLAELQHWLQMPHLPAQKVIATAAGVDQGMVSKARNGLLVRLTPRVEQLITHMQQRVANISTLQGGLSHVEDHYEYGSNPYARDDIRKHIEQYLADGFDAGLLLTQLALLRKAQKSKAGRPPKSDRRKTTASQ